MSVATIFVNVEKGIEVAAEDVLKWSGAVQKAAPNVLGALGVLAAGVDTALGEAATAASADGLNIAADAETLADLKAAWPEVKTFLLTLGIKIA